MNYAKVIRNRHSEAYMEQEAYQLFTQAHRAYMRGIRAAIREHLESAYGGEWWERGVLTAIGENQQANIARDLEKGAPVNLENLLDTVHFHRIIAGNHARAFADAFTDLNRTLRLLRHLSTVRNEWAHVRDEEWTPTGTMQAVQAMREILISLRRREALEIHEMCQYDLDQQGDIPEEALVTTEDSTPSDDIEESEGADRSLLSFWRSLESYLLVESAVEPARNEAHDPERAPYWRDVVVRVTNTAPVSVGRPEIHFKNVRVSSRGGDGRSSDYYHRDGRELDPGESLEQRFTFLTARLAAAEFDVTAEVDYSRLFRMQRHPALPTEAVTPQLEELTRRLDDIDIEGTLKNLIDVIARIRPEISLAEISAIRQELTPFKLRLEEQVGALCKLVNEYGFDDAYNDNKTALGEFFKGAIKYLRELGNRKIDAMDQAIGETNIELMHTVANDIQQLQLSILHTRETIRQIMSVRQL